MASVCNLLAATTNATSNATKDASRVASNATSAAINQFESFGSIWTKKFDLYRYKGDNLKHEVTDNVQDVHEFFGSFLDAKMIQVKIFGSGIPDGTAICEKLRASLNPAAKLKAGSGVGIGAISSASHASTSGSIGRQNRSELSLKDEFELRGQAVDNTWVHHDFIIVQCELNGKKMFFSMEKMTHAIVIQIAEDERPLREKTQNRPRENVFNIPFEIDACKADLSPRKVIRELIGELDRAYNLPLDNCQYFAQRVFEYLANLKKYPSNVKTEAVIYENLKNELLKFE